jgi:uncharacterized membrane protein
MLPTTRDNLRNWIEAGLIDAATAERILAFEAERAKERDGESWRPGIPELLIYLAAAITAAGFAVLVATNWGHLASAARIAIPAVSSAAVFSLGWWLRRTPNEAMVRAASLLWLVAGGLAVATVTIAAAEANWSENNVALAGGTAAIFVAVGLWVPMRMHPQIVGLGGAAFLFSTALSSRVSEDWIIGVNGASLATFGLAALVAVERGLLVPRSSARLLAGLGLGFGGFMAGLQPSPPVMELVAVVAAVVLLSAGIRFQSLVYVGFGVFTVFGGLLTLILRYVESPTLAGLALMAVGLLLMGAIVGLSKTRPWSHWRGTTPAPNTAHPGSA